MHGMTMIFLYALPMLSGFSNYLWPLLLGSRDMAFPRLNALSYWIYPGRRDLPVRRAFRSARRRTTAGSTTCRTPRRQYNPGLNIDFYALGHDLARASRPRSGAINFVVTLLRTRAPGMSINRVPIIIWGTLTASVGQSARGPGRQPRLLHAVDGPPASARISSTCREAASRCCGSTCSGCSAIPGSTRSCCRRWASSRTALPVFCRRPLVGYTPVALSTVATMILGFGVWVHHMFATGLPHAGAVVLRRRLDRHRHPERRRGLRLDRHDLDRAAGQFTTAVPVLRRLHRRCS